VKNIKIQKFSDRNGSKHKKQNKTDECFSSSLKTWFLIQSGFRTKKGMFLFINLHKLRIKGSKLLMIDKIT